MTCDHAKRCGDCFTAERVAALEAENADLIRRVREAETKAKAMEDECDVAMESIRWFAGKDAREAEALTECPACRGRGRYEAHGHGDWLECDDCDGSGRLDVLAERDAFASRVREAERERDRWHAHRMDEERIETGLRVHALQASLDAREARITQLMHWLGDVAVRLGVIAKEDEPWKYSSIVRAIEAMKRDLDVARIERDAAIAAMEARPAITPEDAARWVRQGLADHEAIERVAAALREHGKAGG